MAMVLNPTPVEGEVADIGNGRNLVYRSGKWVLLQDNIIVEGQGIPYSKLIDVPATFPPADHGHSYADLSDVPEAFPPVAHKHQRVKHCNFSGDFATGPGENAWHPEVDITLKGCYIYVVAAQVADITIDIKLGGLTTVFPGTKPTLTAGQTISARIDFDKVVTASEFLRVDVEAGSGKNMTVVLIYE